MANEAKPTKRRVKNPETFRERALKAAEADDQPKQKRRFLAAIGRILRAVFRPIGGLFRRIGKLKILKPFRKPARLIGRIVYPKYFRESWRELKLVTWPSLKESRQLTVAVLIFAVLFGATIALVDYGLDKAFKDFLLK
jgi:preprotein translocase SecE subunit